MHLRCCDYRGAGLGSLMSPAGASPTLPNLSHGLSSGAVTPVAEGCGRGWHWVGAYRDRYGNWIRGRCVPN